MTQQFSGEEPVVQPAIEASPAEIVRDGARSDGRHRLAMGILAGGIAIGGVLGVAEFAHGHDANVRWRVPYIPAVQTVAEHVDSALEGAGIAFPLAAAGIGAVDMLGRRRQKLAAANTLSTVPYITDGASKSKASKIITVSAAMTASAAALGGFVGSIGTEVSQGDLRVIRYMINSTDPGAQSLIGEYGSVEPMVQSNLNPAVEKRIEQEAQANHIGFTPFDLNLGSFTSSKSSGTELTLAVPHPKGFPEDFSCSNVPVIVDGGAGIPVGQHIKLDGVTAEVIGHTAADPSSMDRIGIVTSSAALKECIEQDASAPDYGILLDTSSPEAAKLLTLANLGINAPAEAISTDQFLGNSEVFWDNNVKALVGILALAALSSAFMAMGAEARERVLRDRRFWAQSRAMGVSENFIRGVEVLHAARIGVRAALLGTIPAVLVASGADAAIPGYEGGVGIREAALGGAVAVLGSVGGALLSIRKPDKILKIREQTRN